jgi:hypothetical protein
MDRDEYLRRASALEKRAGDFAYPGLRTALLNTAAQYRNRANQTVVSRADAKFLSNEHPRGPCLSRVQFGSPDILISRRRPPTSGRTPRYGTQGAISEFCITR